MAREALYFPTIRVPHSDWFVRMLLYWDAVSTIVPARMAHAPRILGTRMLNYVDYGLVKIVEPDRYLWDRPQFHDEFLATLDGMPELERRSREFAGALGDRERAGTDVLRLHADKLMRVHSGKTDYRLMQRLEHLGLATRDTGPEWDAWWLIEAEIARRYMAALARLLASVEDDEKSVMDPITDRDDDLEALRRADAAFAERLGEIRSELLTVALPSVTGPVSAYDLSQFKKRCGPLFVDFRQEIESRAIAIAQEERRDVREALRRNALDGLENNVSQIERLLTDSSWKVDPKGTLLRLSASVGVSAAKTALSPTAVLDELPKAMKAVKKAFQPESDGSGVGRTAYAAVARRHFRRKAPA